MAHDAQRNPLFKHANLNNPRTSRVLVAQIPNLRGESLLRPTKELRMKLESTSKCGAGPMSASRMEIGP